MILFRIKTATATSILLLLLGTTTAFGGDSQSPFCKNAIELSSPEDLTQLIELGGNGQLVLLGESTHGTAEFYRWRAEVSKRLIAEKGFNFIAVEGDWASIYRLNLYVKYLCNSYTSAGQVLRTFSRWPEWMWANTEVELLAEWLREYNKNLPDDKRVGIYGMDVYGQWEAMEEVLRIVEQKLPERLDDIKAKFDCYTAYNFDEWQYARAVTQGYPACSEGLEWVVEILREHLESIDCPTEAKLLRHAKQSAKVVQNSEDFYRLAVRNDVTSWNSRVLHMHNTVMQLLKSHGTYSKGIVWAHNTHIGDARATSMLNEGMINIGQLTRQSYGDQMVTLVGFTTYKGTVNAGAQWGSPMTKMSIPKAQKNSAEALLKDCEFDSFYTIFDDEMRRSEDMLKPLGHRAIGVTYNPSAERLYNYVPSILPLRYDALVFIKRTNALDVVSGE